MKPAIPIVVVVVVDGVAVDVIDPATWDDGTRIDQAADLSAALAVTTAQAIADVIAT